MGTSVRTDAADPQRMVVFLRECAERCQRFAEVCDAETTMKMLQFALEFERKATEIEQQIAARGSHG